jgi:predicted MFS family arabinose efflux permease
MGGYQLSQQNLVLEFGSRENLPLRIGVANTASELAAALGLILSGVLVVQLSYLPVFWIAIGFKVLASLLTLLLVREPRFR